jgi:hypothetical protein
MNILQYLQQGGFILPQQSQSQLTYNVPQSAMQVANTAMQVDQNALNRYVQLEQLNLQEAQADRSFFTTLETQRQQRETNERLNKQMDLTNKKLEFEQTKYAYDQFDEVLKWEQDNIEPRHRAEQEEWLKKNKLDNESILNGNFDAMTMIKQASARKSGQLMQSKWLTEKQLIKDGKSLIDAANLQAKEFDNLIAKGVPIKPELLTEFTQAQSTAMQELMQYREGKINALDLSAPHWQVLSSYPDIIDQEMRTEMLQLDMDKKKQAIDVSKLDMKNTELEMQVKEQDLKRKERLAPVEEMLKNIQGMKVFLDEMPTVTAISKYLPKVDINNGQELFDAVRSMNPEQLDALRKDLQKAAATKAGNGLPQSLDQALAWSLYTGDMDKAELILKGMQTKNTTKHTAKYEGIPEKDAAGNTVQINYGDGRYEKNGVMYDKDGNFLSGSFGGVKISSDVQKDLFAKNKIQVHPQDDQISMSITDALTFYDIETSYFASDETDLKNFFGEKAVIKNGRVYIKSDTAPTTKTAPATTTSTGKKGMG